MGIVERDEQLARLHEAAAHAAAGGGRVVCVAGEAGIGKTALVETFLAGLDGACRVAVGRCEDLATARALGPFVDIAAALHAEAAADRDGLLAAVLAALRAGPPTVLVVEDAHWADAPTTDLIALLGRRAVALPLLLVVTYRDEEVDQGHPLRRALGNLATSSAVVWIALAPLSLDGVRQLAARSGVPAEEVHRLTDGNPFFVTETLAAPPGAIATSVRMAVLARASRLPGPARAVLDAASVVPGRVEPWLLDALSDETSSIGDCLAAGVLVAGSGDYAFRHELGRRAIEHELDPRHRLDLHRRATAALDARPGSDPARVAYHAERAGDRDRLAIAAAAACRDAVARGAYDAAVRHGEQALAVADRLDADPRAELWQQYGQALEAVARINDAFVWSRRAVDHWHRTANAVREAGALKDISNLLASSGRVDEALDAVDRAVRLLEAHPPGPDLVRAYVGLTGLHMLARERDLAVRWGEKAIALATALDDQPNLAYALIQCGIADVMDTRFEGLDRVRRGIEIGRVAAAPWVVALGYSQIGSGCGELRRYDVAVPALVDGAGYAAGNALEESRSYLVAWLARCRFDLGRWGEAEALAAEALAIGSEVGITRFVALNTLGWLRARRGDSDVWPLLDEALDYARRSGHLQRLWPCAVARAEAGWLAGDLAPHVDLLAEVVELAGRCRHLIALGELGVWLGIAGRPVADAGAEPFASWTRGDHAVAADGFAAMGCPYEAALVRFHAGDTSSLLSALVAFEALGGAPGAERVAGELRRRGVRVGGTGSRTSPMPAEPAGLTVREREVVRLVAAGFTNPQIAAALYISRKTAEHHVSGILMKLGVATRTEAAAAAVRLGLVDR